MVAGIIFRPEGALGKDKGRAVKGFGPVKGWHLHFDKDQMQVRALLPRA